MSSKKVHLQSLLVKPASADCNLHCTYCFYHDRPTDPYRETSHHRMDDQVLAAMIRQYMALSGSVASFGWQGGEPLLTGVDFFRRVIEYQKRFGRSGQSVGNGVQTNGCLITREWAELFRTYHFLVGVSLDGPEEVHDFYRRTVSEAGSFERVMEGIRILREYGVEFNILSVVNRRTAEMADTLYEFFLSHDLRYLQYIPCVEVDPETGERAEFAVTSDQYGRFLCRLFDRWYNNGQPEVSIRLFDNLLSFYAGYELEQCEFKEQCGQYVVVEYNGDVYPCDFLVEERFYLGNLLRTPLGEIMEGPRFRAFLEKKPGPFRECTSCRWQALCHNGCPRLRYVLRGRFEDRHALCSAYQRFFAYSAERLQALSDQWIAQGRIEPGPRRAERRLQSAVPKRVGRNDPCPCGSGKKYKKCCGR